MLGHVFSQLKETLSSLKVSWVYLKKEGHLLPPSCLLGEDSKKEGLASFPWAQIPMWHNLVVRYHLARSGGTTSEVVANHLERWCHPLWEVAVFSRSYLLHMAQTPRRGGASSGGLSPLLSTYKYSNSLSLWKVENIVRILYLKFSGIHIE